MIPYIQGKQKVPVHLLEVGYSEGTYGYNTCLKWSTWTCRQASTCFIWLAKTCASSVWEIFL